jgi:hypothetical protein
MDKEELGKDTNKLTKTKSNNIRMTIGMVVFYVIVYLILILGFIYYANKDKTKI